MSSALHDFVMGRSSLTDTFTFLKVSNAKFSDAFSGYIITIDDQDYLINASSLSDDTYEVFKIVPK